MYSRDSSGNNIALKLLLSTQALGTYVLFGEG